MLKIINHLPMSQTVLPVIVVLILSSCTPLQIQEQKDENYCGRIADSYAQVSTQPYANLDELYTEFLNHFALQSKPTPEQAKAFEEATDRFAKSTSASKKQQFYAFYQDLNKCVDLQRYDANDSPVESALSPHGISLINDFRMRIENAYVPDEKRLFLKRTGGKTLCGTTLHDFFYNPNMTPNAQCLYPIPPNYIPLQAMQVTPEGVLVKFDAMPGRTILIYNDNKLENSLVDNAAIQPGYFEYEGNYSYASLLGMRSVYSFRRIADPFPDILFYRGN